MRFGEPCYKCGQQAFHLRTPNKIPLCDSCNNKYPFDVCSMCGDRGPNIFIPIGSGFRDPICTACAGQMWQEGQYARQLEKGFRKNPMARWKRPSESDIIQQVEKVIMSGANPFDIMMALYHICNDTAQEEDDARQGAGFEIRKASQAIFDCALKIKPFIEKYEAA